MQEPSASAFPGSANATSDDTPGASSVNGPSRELDGPEESTSTQYLPGDARPSVSQAESPALLHTGASPAASTPRLSPFAGRAGRAGEPRGEDAGAWSPEAGGSEMSFRMQAAATGASEGLGGGVARAHEGSRVGASGTGSDGGNVDGGRGDGQDGAATREHSPEGDKEGESAAPSVAGDADSRVESEVDAVLAALGDSVAMSDSLGLGGMQATLVA